VHARIVARYPEIVAGRMDEALELIDPDILDHRGGADGDVRGRAAWQAKWEHIADGFHDVSATVEQTLAVGDTSVNRYTLRGTQDATGRSYAIGGIDMVRVRDGRIVEHWAFGDWASMAAQLGG